MTMNTKNHYIGAEQIAPEAFDNAGSKPLQGVTPLVKVDALAYVMFERPDLDRQLAFLKDFGMQVAEHGPDAIYLRGHGSSPWFYRATRGARPRYLGAGYTVNSEAELEGIAARHGKKIEHLEGPGGGRRVRLHDPDGFIADFVHGREPAVRTSCRDTTFKINTPGEKARVNNPVRSSAEPCPLEKIGHLVMAVTNFERSARWYMENLGLIPSDVQCVADGSPVLAFMRCDRGETPADHHTVVLVQNLAPALMHTAYETLDIDSIGQGAQYLRWKGWKHFWGIGRHILGSQIFDYWLDPHGVEMEHYADGDVFTADHPTRYHPLSQGSLYTWGDDLPPTPKPGLWQILKLVISGKAKDLLPVLGKMRTAMAATGRPWIR
jgi:catechol 2,3-dioxygenase-like lactoylglutathione lyase family enzyme